MNPMNPMNPIYSKGVVQMNWTTPFVLLTFIKLVVLLLRLHHRQRFSIYVLRRILRFVLIQ